MDTITRPTRASIVGIRALWCCEVCRSQANSYQLVKVDALDAINPPAEWIKTRDGRVFCEAHKGLARWET